MLTAFESSTHAQFYNGSQLTFGKNRIQHKNFIWNYYRFSEFDTYFYANGAPLAQHCARYGREQLRELESTLQTNLDGKIQFVIFNTLTDLKQSNLGLLSNEKYNIGGVTHILGRKVLLYFDGDYGSFEKQIRAGLSKILLDQLIYGSSLGSQVKNNALSNYPEWYISGLISYLSEDWNTRIDNFVKDGILKGRYAKLNSLKEIDALYAGHSFWKFIGDKYGRNVIPAIVYASKMSRKVANGFSSELGVTLPALEKLWLADLKARYQADELNRNPLPKNLIIPHPKLEPLYHRLRLSPDGQKAAYLTNEAGKSIVYIYDFAKKKSTRIYSLGHRLDEKVDDTYPLLAWHPTGKVLAMVVERKGFINIDFYTVAKKQWVTKIIYNLDKILDFSYSSDGLNFVMSAILKGQSDLFVFNVASNSYEQLTNDTYNDLNPRFINNNTEIVFSSNRTVDTLPSPKVKVDENIKYNPNNDIFIYDYANRSNKLKRITNTPLANDYQPVEWAAGHIGFLSDESGISNAYIAGYDSTLTAVDTISHYRYFSKNWSISNYKRNITDFDASVAARKVAMVVFEDRRYRMFTTMMLEPGETEPLKVAGTTYHTAIEKQAPEYLKVATKKRSGHRRLTNVLEKEILIPKDSVTGAKIKVPHDTTLHEFSRASVLAIPKKDSLYKLKYLAVTNLVKLDTTRSGTPPQQNNYDVEYFVNELVSQIDYSNLNTAYQPFSGGNGPIYLNPTMNALLMVGGTDLLEDYRISGGVRLNPDLVNNEYMLSFANLKHRFDKEFVFHRSSLEETDGYYTLRHKIHEASFIGTYPFTNVFAAKGTFSFRNDRSVWLALDKPSLQQKDEVKSWLSLKGELVYDNTREIETNILQGTRFKVFGEYYYQLNKANSTLSSVGFDFRHYLRIHRCFIWANRIAGASSFGQNKIIYYLGGVDNWIGAKFNKDIPIDYTQNYAYQTLATSMRGFDQNIRNGNSFMVINSELRFPVFKYFLNSPTRIGIIDNFQIVGFGDVGTAWTGPNPFGNNALFTREVYQKPIMVVVHEQRDPIVEGMGFGLRSRLFGYFIRADWAWGIEDGIVQPRKFYISLSLDF